MKRTLSLMVVSLGMFQFGCVPSQVPISSAVKVDADIERLASIRAKAPKGEEQQIFLSNLVFGGPIKSGVSIEYTEEEAENWLKGNATFVTINRRVAKLQDGGPIGFGKDGGSVSSKESVQLNMRAFLSFGFQVIEILRPRMKPQYYAVSPSRTTEVHSVAGSPLISKPRPPKLNRSDFINPQDVDWMLGVDDFTKVKSDL